MPEERWPKTLWPRAGVACRPGAGPLPTCRLSHSLCVTVLPPQDAGLAGWPDHWVPGLDPKAAAP